MTKAKDEAAAEATADAPAEASEPEAEPTVTIAVSVLEAVKAQLQRFSFGAVGDGGSVKCPVCKQSPALDPANPRDFEDHAADCGLGNAIKALP